MIVPPLIAFEEDVRKSFDNLNRAVLAKRRFNFEKITQFSTLTVKLLSFRVDFVLVLRLLRDSFTHKLLLRSSRGRSPVFGHGFGATEGCGARLLFW